MYKAHIVRQLTYAAPLTPNGWLRYFRLRTGTWFGARAQPIFNLLLVSKLFNFLIKNEIRVDEVSVYDVLVTIQMEKLDFYFQRRLLAIEGWKSTRRPIPGLSSGVHPTIGQAWCDPFLEEHLRKTRHNFRHKINRAWIA